MTGKVYLTLQVGMFVTDKADQPRREDFCTVQQFDRMGRMKLQPLDCWGRPKGEACWVHYKDYELQDKMYRSEFLECIPGYGD